MGFIKNTDWKFWILIIGVALGIYKTIILSDNHVNTIEKKVDKILVKVDDLSERMSNIEGYLNRR